jgi:hypothetical protein
MSQVLQNSPQQRLVSPPTPCWTVADERRSTRIIGWLVATSDE